MIEQLMYFALGVLVTGLLALIFLPAFWRRAVRLSTRRIEMQLPLSMTEIVAERDLLRAEFAVVQRRLERRLELLGDARAADMSEIGRKSAIIGAHAQEMAGLRAELARLEGVISTQAAAVAEAQAQTGAALKEAYDESGAREAAELKRVEFFRAAEQAQALAEERRLVIAGLETRLAGLEMRLGDAHHELAARDKTLLARDAVLDRVTDERDRARAEAAGHAAKVTALQAQLEERERRLAALDDRQAELTREKAALERRILDLSRAEMERVSREPEARGAFERQLEAARETERKLVADLDRLRAEKASLQGALEISRAELAGRAGGGSIRRIGPAAAPEPAPEALRHSISDLGAEVLRIAAELETVQPSSATRAAERADAIALVSSEKARAS
ncbi:MAG: hypothetical protein K2Y29_00675 [Beijerinckiaceae bacterium]|nr:hypothetical protein [Beijerinckiaceae bacterium]